MEDLLSTDACTLPTAERPVRLAEFDQLYAASAREVTREEVGEDLRVRIRLSGDGGLRERIEDLAARESECCSFFTFRVEGDDGQLVLDVTVPRERRDILGALADRAEACAANAVSG